MLDSFALVKTLDPDPYWNADGNILTRTEPKVGDVGEGYSVATVSSVVVMHPNGHMVPAKGVAKSTFKDFMLEQRRLLQN